MTTFYFVRHGKTEWNLEGRYQGSHGDSPLLPESYEEIKQLAAYFNSEKIRTRYLRVQSPEADDDNGARN